MNTVHKKKACNFCMLDVMISLEVSYSYVACSTSSEVVSLIKGTQPPASRHTIVWHGFIWLNDDDDGQLGGNKTPI